MPTVTGNYLLKSVYKGSENYLGARDTVNFAIEPFVGQSVFSVTSNSTITGLAFNSVSKELNLNVSGPTETTGYTNVYIPTSIMTDVSGLKVYLDSSQIDYTTQSQSDCWLISINYHHSSHEVTVSLGSLVTNSSSANAPAKTATFGLDWVEIVILAFMSVTLAIVVITSVLLLRRKKLK